MAKEKKNLEERALELAAKLIEEEDKSKMVNKQRTKFETQMQEAEDQLNKEKLVCNLWRYPGSLKFTSKFAYF